MNRISQIFSLFAPIMRHSTGLLRAGNTTVNSAQKAKTFSVSAIVCGTAGVVEDGEDPMKISNKEWKERLPAERYHVMRESGTERPFTGLYNSHYDNGIYYCAGCGTKLFDSHAKFDSGSGWPSFYEGIKVEDGTDNIHREVDDSYGMVRVEVKCKKCDAHLGHVFNDGPNPTGERYCINSLSLEFHPKK